MQTGGRRLRWVAWVAAACCLSACAATPPPVVARSSCPLVSQSREVSVTLYFGREAGGRAKLRELAWSQFARKELTPRFPSGMTVLDGAGQWRNPGTGQATSEAAKVVVIVTPDSPDLAARIGLVTDAYKRQFSQMSVGVVTSEVCAAF